MFGKLKNEFESLSAKNRLLANDAAAARDMRLLSFFVKIVEKLVDVERCSIFINDPSNGTAWLKCGSGVQERQIEVDVSSSIAGQVISSGERQMLTQMQERDGAHRNVALETGFVTRDLLCVPVNSVYSGERIGAIQALNKKGDKTFTDEDVALLEEIAFHLQMIIERAFVSQEAVGFAEKLIGYSTRAFYVMAWAVGVPIVLLSVVMGALIVAPMLR